MEPSGLILIIDDDEKLRTDLRIFLEEVGLRVLDAPDGARGLELAVGDRPDLVLLDLNMPGMNGFEVCQAIMGQAGDWHPAVIVMSGLLGTSQRVRAFHAGAVDCLAKPIQYEELEIRVKTHLAIRKKTLELRESRDRLGAALHDADVMNHSLLALNRKLQHSEEVKTRFLALMRNEINNPLGDIMGLADRIADPLLPPEKGRELAAMVKHEAFHLDCQMRNVFTAAEVEAGEASPFIARVDVVSVAKDVLTSFGPSARAKGLELRTVLQGMEEAFPTDGDMLHHILANLVSNGVQYGAGSVEVRMTGTEQGLCLEVEDRGQGMSEAALNAVFEPFRNAGGPFKIVRGQGLGLVVVKALVDILDGRLDMESGPGGSTFRVTLPPAPLGGDGEPRAQDDNVIFFDGPLEF